MKSRGWVALLLSVAIAALCACGSGGSSPSNSPAGGGPAPTMAEMELMLQAEFDRLGINPDKVTAKAPQKEENAVFDFAGELDDPDGEGGDPPTGITLTWTERLIADYNQDGMVTANDLTPIGQNYCFDTGTPQVTYDDPGDHNGIQYWPTGDPDDGADGSLNWRLAVVDGNNDGRILMHDITPIAVHYEEHLTGYRIWRKAPGGSFEVVPNPDDAGSDVTIPRPSTTSATAPVRYSFTDTQATTTGLGEGTYAYFIQPWDGSSSTSGPASLVLVIDNTGTITPQQPVAQLTVSPDFGGAPVEVTLDASGSTDSDGTVDVWHWDFDADGVTDWVSTDPVPVESSSQVVTDVNPISAGIVSVTYRSGSALWYFPTVYVEDNSSLMSLPAYAQLGVSGWLTETVTDETTDLALLNFSIRAISSDPVTDQTVVAGDAVGLWEWDIGQPPGLYFARRISESEWVQEQVVGDDTPIWQEFEDAKGECEPITPYIFWHSNNQPGIVFVGKASNYIDHRIMVSLRDSDGIWTTSLVWAGNRELESGFRGAGINAYVSLGPGKFVLGSNDIIAGSASGGTEHQYVVWYDNGEVIIDDTGLEIHGPTQEEGDRAFSDVAVDNNGTAYCLFYFGLSDHSGSEIWALKRESVNNWVDVRLCGNYPTQYVESPRYDKFEFDEYNRVNVLGSILESQDMYDALTVLIRESSDSAELYPISKTTDIRYRVIDVYKSVVNPAIAALVRQQQTVGGDRNLIHYRISDSYEVVELVHDNINSDPTERSQVWGYHEGTGGTCKVALFQYANANDADAQLIKTRVDPRLR